MSWVLKLKTQARKKVMDYHRLEKSPKANAANVAIARAQAEFLVAQIKEQLEQIGKMGAMAKGLDPCLVDFPYRLNGREVYLCWKYGEENISCYHGLEEGYAGRKPLPTHVLYKDVE